MTDKATHPGAGTSRLEAMDNIARVRVEGMANDLGIDPQTIHSDVKPPTQVIPGGEEDKTGEEVEKKADEEIKETEEEIAAKEKKDPDPVVDTKGEEEEEDVEYIDVSPEDERRYRFRTKVDGEERFLTAAEVKRGYQKDATASKRLEQAALRAKELDEREQDIARREQEALARNTSTGKVEVEEETDDDQNLDVLSIRDDVKTFLDTFYGGKEEEAEAALTELLSKVGRTQKTVGDATQTQTVDETAVAAKVEDSINFKAAREYFRENYEDIWSDQPLAKMADEYFEEELETGVSYKEAFINAGDRVRDWLKEHGASVTTPEKSAKTREQKKEDIDNLESTGATSTTIANEEKPQGVSDVIKEMAASRGANRQYQT